MSTSSIYDDPIVVPKPTNDEVRIAELRAIIANETAFQEQANAAKELCKSIEDAIYAKRVAAQKALERELAPLRAQLSQSRSEENTVRLQLFDISNARTELVKLSPLSKKLDDLHHKLFEASLDKNRVPIRPNLLVEIEEADRGTILVDPRPELAYVKRRELKRHDEMLAEIQDEINEVSRQIGLIS